MSKFAFALAPAIGLTVATSAWSQSAAELYEKGLVSYNMAEVRTAYIHLKNALKEDPNLLSALLLLGKIHLALGNGADAEEQLKAAIRLGAHRSMTLVPMAQAYLMQGKSQRVISELFPLGNDATEDAELLALRGQAHLDLGEPYDAERSFDQAWERAPDSVPALIGRVKTKLARGAVEEAFASAQRASELDPNNAQVLHLKAGIERDRGDFESALADFERSVEIEPAHLPAQIGRVGVLVEMARIDEAAAAIAQIRERYPMDPRTLYLEAVIANRLGDHQGAVRALQDAESLIAQLPEKMVESHAPTLLLAGMVAFSLNKWEQAGDYLDLYRKRRPDAVGPRKLLAQIMIERGQYEGAIVLLEPALQLAPSDPGLLSLLADAYMRDGLYLKAAQLIDRAIDVADDDPALQTQQAVNAYALGRSGQAIDQLSAIFLERPNQRGAGASLVVMLMQQRQFERAAEIAEDLVLQEPKNLTYLNLRGAAHLALAHNDIARQSFEAVLEVDPGFIPSVLNLAKLELGAGDSAAARTRLEALLEDQPRHAGAMLELARAFEAQGMDKEAVRWAENALSENLDSAAVSVYLTDLLLKVGDSARAAEVADAMELRAPRDPEVLAAVARAYIASGQHSTAQVVLQRTSSLAGYNARMLLRIAALQQKAGDPEGAAWSLRKAAEGEPDFVPARIRHGEVLAALGRTEKAERVADGLQRDFPQEPFGYHLLGIIDQGQGDYASALKHYLAALERKGDSPILATRVYEATRLVEGNEAALDFLSAWDAAHPGDAIARQALGEAYYQAGRLPEAQTLFEQLLAENPDSPVLLNNLALLFLQVEDPRALEYAQRAYDLVPNVPHIADTLGWSLVRSGRHQEGLKHLRDAQSRSAADPGIGYHIAVALNELGRSEDAVAQLKRVVASQVDFAERAEAEEMLERLQSK